MGKVGNLGVGVRMAGPGRVSGEFYVLEGFVPVNLGFDLLARPHPGFNVLIVVCNGRDVTDDDFGPGNVLLECNLVLLLFQGLDDGDTRLFKGCVFGVSRELEGKVVAFGPFGGEAAEAVKVFVGFSKGVDFFDCEEGVLSVHGVVLFGGLVSESDDPVVGSGGLSWAADGGHDLWGRGGELGRGFGSG